MEIGVGKRIKELRSFLKLTQEQFARPLGVDRGHIAGIETGSRNPSEPLVKLMHFIYCVNETWLKTGKGEIFIPLEDQIKEKMTRFGERAIIEAFNNIMREPGLAVAAGRTAPRADTGDPELDRMVDILYDLWAAGDDRLKSWASVQFDYAFPKNIVEDAQKKQKEDYENTKTV